MKKCTKCGVQKPLSEFNKQRSKKSGLRSQCNSCRSSYAAEWYKKNKNHAKKVSKVWRDNNPNKVTNSLLKRRYGLTLLEKAKMLAEQENLCAICKTSLLNSKIVRIDHCHKTQKVRGILCNHCNVLLGQARDSVDILKSAQNYLEKYSSESQEK